MAPARIEKPTPIDLTPFEPKATMNIILKEWQPQFPSLKDLISTPGCREITFISSTQGSLIKQILLKGYPDGKIAFYVTVEKTHLHFLSFIEYLYTQGVDSKENIIYADNPEKIRNYFNILKPFFSMDDATLSIANEIIQHGSCDSII